MRVSLPRMLPALAVTVIATSTGLACSTDSDASRSTAATLDPPSAASGFPADWTAEEPDWHPCDEDVTSAAALECSTLEVPLDWAEPDGESIELALARTSATGERVGTLVTNPGGPGASGIDFLASGHLGSDLTEHFDVVSWDPRGVGRSTAVDCEEQVDELYLADPTPDDDAERAAAQQVAEQVSADCATAGGELLEHLNTEVVARDLEAIRLALGGEKLNYLGFSYGTHIGQEYAELFGNRIRAMVLDGVVDPSLGFEDFLMGQAEAFDAAFVRQAQQCDDAGPGACGVDDLIGAYDRVLADAEAQRIDTSTGHLQPSQVALAATYVGYLDGGWNLLGPALAEGLAGDGTELAALAGSYVDLGDYGPYAGVVCTDSAHPQGTAAYQDFIERVTEVSPRFGPSIAAEMQPCATWPVGPRDAAGPLTAPDAPDILVVGNTGDPATPLRNAEAVADSLEAGVLLVVESDGHTAHGSNTCATRIIDTYLIRLRSPDPGTRC